MEHTLEHDVIQEKPKKKQGRIKWGMAGMLALMIVVLVSSKAFAVYYCDTSLPVPYTDPPPYTPTTDDDIPLNSFSLMRNIPSKIYFPDHRVQSDVFPVGLTETGSIETMDTPFAAAWYKDFAAPGEAGNCIINGHDFWKYRDGYFAVLKKLEVGQEVVVGMEDGTHFYYRVISREEYPIDDFPPEILQHHGEDRLTLITCEGGYDRVLGTSPSRVIVVCQEITE